LHVCASRVPILIPYRTPRNKVDVVASFALFFKGSVLPLYK